MWLRNCTARRDPIGSLNCSGCSHISRLASWWRMCAVERELPLATDHRFRNQPTHSVCARFRAIGGLRRVPSPLPGVRRQHTRRARRGRLQSHEPGRHRLARGCRNLALLRGGLFGTAVRRLRGQRHDQALSRPAVRQESLHHHRGADRPVARDPDPRTGSPRQYARRGGSAYSDTRREHRQRAVRPRARKRRSQCRRRPCVRQLVGMDRAWRRGLFAGPPARRGLVPRLL